MNYRGHTKVRAYVAHLCKSTADGSTSAKRSERAQVLSPRALRWRLSEQSTDLNQEEQAQLDQLLRVSPEVLLIHKLLHAFLDMVRKRQRQHLRLYKSTGVSRHPRQMRGLLRGTVLSVRVGSA